MTRDELNQRLQTKYPITENQFKFLVAYASHGNGMKAVREAGYNHQTRGSQSSAAYKLLSTPRIKEALEIVKNG